MRWFVIVTLAIIILPCSAAAQPTCSFVLGFASFRDLVGPSVVGDCAEAQWTATGPMLLEWQPGTSTQVDAGSAVQKTTNGLLIWRPTDNSIWFFSADRTYILTAEYGLRVAPFPGSGSAANPTPQPHRQVAVTGETTSTEITLFDQQGRAVAYIALDDEATIFTWAGKPVAYVYRVDSDLHIYNFAGRHLGWFDSGLVLDHQGNVVGFRKGALNVPTQLEPFKGFREFKPFMSFREFAPFKPMRSGRWSAIPLDLFLLLP